MSATAVLDRRKPRVFISHSTHEPEARGILERLVAALQGDGFDVLVDYQRLEDGWEWRDVLYTWLAQCDAAVALLSPAALDRPWVKAEAQCLWYRRRNERDFPLLPMLVLGTTPDDFKQLEQWDPVPLSDLQSCVWPEAAVGAAAEIAARVLKDLQPLKERVARTPLEVALAGKLGEIGGEAVVTAARALGLELVGDERYVKLARGLLSAELPVLAEAVGWLAVAKPEIAYAIFALAVAHTWVDADAAARIVEAMLRRHAVGINSDRPWTSEMYVRRASTTFPFWDVVSIEAGRSGEIEDMISSARAALIRRLGLADSIDDTALDLELRRRAIFLAVPCPLLDLEIVTAFRRAFPAVTHFFLAGEIRAADVAGRGYSDLEFLVPELDPARERAALDRFNLIKFNLEDVARRARAAYDLPLAS